MLNVSRKVFFYFHFTKLDDFKNFIHEAAKVGLTKLHRAALCSFSNYIAQ